MVFQEYGLAMVLVQKLESLSEVYGMPLRDLSFVFFNLKLIDHVSNPALVDGKFRPPLVRNRCSDRILNADD
jgi:hypothetical protein